MSSIFDFLTFGILLLVLHATQTQFRTAWFIESLLTELFIILVIRTRRSALRSRPGRMLVWSTLAVSGVALVLPWTSIGQSFGLIPLPAYFLLALVGITLLYLAASEWLKRRLLGAGAPCRISVAAQLG